jgi:putative ubiquitin-RnfH superfamily antitoxin RatB of RatAB toxin-antitoxin module
VKLGDVLKEGDRVEIYRPLIADPKELRRQRAEKSGSFVLTLTLSPKARG